MVGFANYRTANLSAKLRIGGFYPLDVMLAGSTGAGKSTIVNALVGRSVAKVGVGVDPETQTVSDYRLNDSFRVWDTPGLGDGVGADAKHKKKITELLTRECRIDGGTYGLIDLAIVVVEGSHRDIGSCISLLNEVIVPCISKDRILVIVNQADVAMKGHHWDACTNRPDEVLNARLEDLSDSIQRRVHESSGIWVNKPVCFSAETGYNMDKVCDAIIDSIPRSRRTLSF